VDCLSNASRCKVATQQTRYKSFMEQNRSARCSKQGKKGSSRAREWSLCLLLDDVSRWRCGEETKTCAKCACSLSEVDAEVPKAARSWRSRSSNRGKEEVSVKDAIATSARC
jgi:hypothetical protein